MKTPSLSALSSSATAMIRTDHAAALALFRKLQPDTSDMVRQATVRQLCTALEVHAQVEEEFFYPALRGVQVEMALLDTSAEEHAEMREGIERVRAASPGPAQTQALNELMNGVMHHMADEETRLLPKAEMTLSTQRLADIGAAMTKRKLELMRPHAGQLALDTVRGAPAKSGLVALALAGLAVWWVFARPSRAHLDVT